MEQGSDAWKRLRLGKVTASRISDVVAKTKSGWSASRANYAAELIVQRLTGTWQDGFVSSAMLHGTEQEPFARQAYAKRQGVEVLEVPFVLHPEIDMAGASPDGLVGDDGLVEIKCPNSATHLDTLTGQGIADKYFLQMQWQMACTGRDWCDFVSFDPRMPEWGRLHVERVPRDVSTILQLEGAVTEFLAEIEARVAKLTALYAQAEAA